jgi:hypothetical protein
VPYLHFYSRKGMSDAMDHVGIGHLVANQDCITQARRDQGVYCMSMARCPVPDRRVHLPWIDDVWTTQWCARQWGLPRPRWSWLAEHLQPAGYCCYADQSAGELVVQFLLAAGDSHEATPEWAATLATLEHPRWHKATPLELGVLLRKL